jgi:phage-related protein
VGLVPFIGQLVKVGFGALKIALAFIAPLLSDVVGWFKNPVFRVVAIVIGGITLAWLALNAAMMANPIVLIIAALVLLGAGIAQLVKHWRTVWGAIKTALKAVWEHVIKPVFDAFKTAIDAVGKAFTWLYDHIIKPYVNLYITAFKKLWGLFKNIGTWLWEHVARPVIDFFKKLPGRIIQFGKDLFHNFLNGIRVIAKTVGTWLFTHVDRPLIDFFKKLPGRIWNWGKKLFQNFLNGIRFIAKTVGNWLFEHIDKPLIDFFKSLPGKIWTWGKKMFQHFLDGVQNIAKTVRNWLIIHVAAPIVNFFGSLPDKIGKVFDKIKRAIGTPIYWVATHVLRPLLKGINWLITKIGIPAIPIDWINNIPRFAQGGKVPGVGHRDTQVAALTPGEWVLTKRQAAAIGYGTLAGLPRYAAGGPVGGEGGGYAGIAPTSIWGDIGGAMSSAWHGVTGVVAKIGNIIVRAPGDLLRLGKEALAAGAHLLRAAAADAFDAAVAPLRKLALPYARMDVPPHNAFWQLMGKLMLSAISQASDFIRGHSESEIAEAGGPGVIAAKAVEVALKQLGKPYVWASHGPGSFDCSGLTEYSYRMAGYPRGIIPGPKGGIGMNTYEQVKKGQRVNSAIAGDLAFFFGRSGPQPHHVAIATGANEVIQAPDAGDVVKRTSPISAAGMSGDRVMIRRIVAATGGAGDLGNVTASARGIYDAFRSLGWTPAQAAGALGNMQYESTFNPFIIQGGGSSKNPSDAGSGGYGLVQWTPGSKLTAILRWGGKDNTLGNQIWAINEQLHGRSPYPESAAGRAFFANRRNAYQAGWIFGKQYERFGTDTAGGRAASARAFYERLHKYDQGGYLPPGTHTVSNMTRKPEPILTAKQWDDLSAAAAGGGAGGGVHTVTGGSLDIGIDSQGRMRAWVQDMILEEADYTNTVARRGGGW